MSVDTLETTHVHHSHGGEYDDDRGLDNAYPLDQQSALNKFNVATSDPRDIGPEIPKTVSKGTIRKLAMASTKSGGKKVVVQADVHHPGDEETTDEEDLEPDQPDSESSDGRTLWHLRSDVGKGTSATYTAHSSYWRSCG